MICYDYEGSRRATSCHAVQAPGVLATLQTGDLKKLNKPLLPDQAGGAERVGDEESNDGSNAEAAPRGVVAAVGDYLGSWVGMTPVPEGTAHFSALLCAPQRSVMLQLPSCCA